MGNSNFLGYAAGAYNYQEEKRRKDAEEALERQYKQMQLDSMRQRQAEFEYQKGRDRKRDEIEDEKWKLEKESLDEARQSKMLAPIIKPYVPYLNRETPGKSTLEVPLPNKAMGNILSATGMPAIGLPGLPENAIPGQVNFDNFLTGDEESALLKSQQKIAEKKAMIDFEVKKKRALADAGLIRDYNRDPIGSKSKSGSKKYDFYAEPDSSTLSIDTKKPITAPTIKAFQPYKSYEEVLYRGTPEEQAAMSQLFEAENEKLKNSVQAQKNALALLNRSRKDSHVQTIAEAEKQRKRSEAAKLPKIDAGPDLYGQILQFYGFSPEEVASATSDIPGKAPLAPASATQAIPAVPPTVSPLAARQPIKSSQAEQLTTPIVAPQISDNTFESSGDWARKNQATEKLSSIVQQIQRIEQFLTGLGPTPNMSDPMIRKGVEQNTRKLAELRQMQQQAQWEVELYNNRSGQTEPFTGNPIVSTAVQQLPKNPSLDQITAPIVAPRINRNPFENSKEWADRTKAEENLQSIVQQIQRIEQFLAGLEATQNTSDPMIKKGIEQNVQKLAELKRALPQAKQEVDFFAMRQNRTEPFTGNPL